MEEEGKISTVWAQLGAIIEVQSSKACATLE
jgi:hypothetical protein